MTYTVNMARSAAKDLASSKMPMSVVDAVVEFVDGFLAEEPFTVGKPLHEPYEGVWSARRDDYRVLYTWDQRANTVTVLAVRHRADAYRPA